MKTLLRHTSSERLADHWKVPFRSVYASSLVRWFVACWACLVATAKFRLSVATGLEQDVGHPR